MALKEKVPRDGRASYRIAAFAGGVVGLLAFLAVGLVPSLVYGGYAGVSLGVVLLGHPLGASLLARAVVAFGMLTGALATASLFIVWGATSGTLAYWVIDGVAQLARSRAQAAAETPAEADS